MSFVVAVAPSYRTIVVYYDYLSRSYSRRLKGRRKNKRPPRWQWIFDSRVEKAHVFDTFEEALKAARRISKRTAFARDKVAQVWTFDHLALATLARVWPTDDLVTAIGLLAEVCVGEADVEVR